MLWGKRADMIVHEQDPFNAEPPRRALARPRTGLDSFYVRNHGPVPEPDPHTWRLRVHGLVEHPLRLGLDELRTRFSVRHVLATVQCAGNRRAGLIAVRDIPGEDPWGPGATSTAMWTGVRLADVLAVAAPTARAAHVAFAAPDVSTLADPPQRFGGSLPLAKATSGEVLLAWGMNDQPLPAVHGAPVRLVVPGYIGARSIKWLDDITVRATPSDNYFQTTAYRLLPPESDPATAVDGLALGPIALNSEILTPDDGATVPAGDVTVTGYALAGGDRGVARVDVSADDGRTWRPATLDDQPSPWSWRHWRSTLTLPPGPAEIVARAWDTTAAAQPEHARHLWNPKGYVNNAWARLHLTVGRDTANS